MQPQEPPSAEPNADASAAPEARSEPSQPNASNFLAKLWRGMRSVDEEVRDEPAEQAPSTVSLTQEELNRRVQAETDRREFKRQQEAREAERRRLRDEDPWAYAEQDRQAEQAAEQSQNVFSQVGQIEATYDRFALDPLVTSLPEAEQRRILSLQGAGQGLEGRKLIVSEGLKALEKHWKAEGAKDAEERLRRNPAFRKQVLSDARRGVLSDPDFVPSGAPATSDKSVSDILRSQVRGTPIPPGRSQR